jgi:hypothetical protein
VGLEFTTGSRVLVFPAKIRILIVGLDATTKGPSPLVGESKVSRESKVFCSENNYFAFIRILHTNN